MGRLKTHFNDLFWRIRTFSENILLHFQCLNYRHYFLFSELSKYFPLKSECSFSKYRLKLYSFGKFPLCLLSFIMALGPIQPPIQWVQGVLSLGVKRAGREADHSPPTSAEVKEWVELYFHSPNTPPWRGAQLKHRDNFVLNKTPFICPLFMKYSVFFFSSFYLCQPWTAFGQFMISHKTHTKL
jgi:hypothetical protein